MADGILFVTEHARGRAAYKLYASTILAGICMILYYRATHIPATWQEGRWEWIGISLAEFWYAFYWILTQSVRWNPVYRQTFKEKLSQRYEERLPNVDIFVCTADPFSEPPNLVVSTILSLMAYNYPPEKLNVYLSDDGGSILTFYAMWEASQFAKYWIPFCKRYNVEPRAPAAYFSSKVGPNDMPHHELWLRMKILYKEMTSRIDSIVMSGQVPEELKANHNGFFQWQPEMTSKAHPPIVQILIDGKDPDALDNAGNALPTLVYMSREKSPEYHHNFKAGAMNALIRVSSVISDSPVILNVDCDMYSNNSDSIRDALCFFLDEQKGHDIAFVQYPQNYSNLTKNDTYGNTLSAYEVEMRGMDSWGGTQYIGTGCFHRRHILCGMKYTKDYKEDWNRGSKRNPRDDIGELEYKAKSLVTCTYELNTLWGHQVGLIYGIAVEDIITGITIQCRGWKSVYYSPTRKAFLGVGPTTLAQTILQQKRWSEGNMQIFLSKYCIFIYGHKKIKLGLQMGYSIYNLWAVNSIPTLYYVIIPSLSLLRGISLFPKMTSPWLIPFAYVMVAKQIYSLGEALQTREITVQGWWNVQRMWLIKRLTSYLYGTLDSFIKNFGVTKMGFTLTAKVSREDNLKRYEQEIMEFDASLVSLNIIVFVAFLNLACLVGATSHAMMEGWTSVLERYFLQLVLCGSVVAVNVAIYEGALLRKDKGSIPWSVTLTSLGFMVFAFVATII